MHGLGRRGRFSRSGVRLTVHVVQVLRLSIGAWVLRALCYGCDATTKAFETGAPFMWQVRASLIRRLASGARQLCCDGSGVGASRLRREISGARNGAPGAGRQQRGARAKLPRFSARASAQGVQVARWGKIDRSGASGRGCYGEGVSVGRRALGSGCPCVRALGWRVSGRALINSGLCAGHLGKKSRRRFSAKAIMRRGPASW